MKNLINSSIKLIAIFSISATAALANESRINLIGHGQHTVACTTFETDAVIKLYAVNARTQGFCPNGYIHADTKFINTHYFMINVEPGTSNSQFIAQSNTKVFCEDGISTRTQYAPGFPFC